MSPARPAPDAVAAESALARWCPLLPGDLSQHGGHSRRSTTTTTAFPRPAVTAEELHTMFLRSASQSAAA